MAGVHAELESRNIFLHYSVKTASLEPKLKDLHNTTATVLVSLYMYMLMHIIITHCVYAVLYVFSVK